MDAIEIIKKRRKQLNITQEKISEYLNLPRTAYAKIESHNQNLKLEDFLKIIKYLDLPITVFSDEQLIVISQSDLIKLNKHLTAISDITKKLDNQYQTVNIQNDSTNIQIGDHNSINNSFNKK